MLYDDILGVGSPALSTYIINSAELTDYLIDDFKSYIDEGYHPDDVKYEIFANRNASTDDLTLSDKNRLEAIISTYYEEKING